jgi:DNA (cytosine-5)-methyltransferase 1
LALPNYPQQQTKAADGKGKAPTSLQQGPTVAEALDDLPEAEFFDALQLTDEVRPDAWGTPSLYASELRCLTNDAWHFGYVRDWDRSLLTSSARTEHTEISRRRFSETLGGETEPVSRFYKLSATGLSNTLRAGTDGARGAFTSPRPIHHAKNRCITVREMARLHGYPDWFRFNETKWHGARQIGNSVPPPLARAAASKVIEALGLMPERPFELVDLGDTKLLRMNLSQAANHFGITAIPSKRDRKSGATKRRQWEIEMATGLAA